MADKAISELVAAQSVTPDSLFVLQQDNTAKKLTAQVLENWLLSLADGHGGIQSWVPLKREGLVTTYRITLADQTHIDIDVVDGRGIESVKPTSTVGLVVTYTITYNDGTTSTFTVTNGEKGDKGDRADIWVKYASKKPTASSHSFGDVPDSWIGIATGHNMAAAPTDWQQYTWFQRKGEKGDTGAPATLASSQVTYQVGDSGTIIPSGSWTTSVPPVTPGKFLWTRQVLQFNTGAPITSYSVSRFGIDGTGSVSTVAGISPDAAGNVPMTASDVEALPIGGGTMEGPINMNGQPIRGLNAPTENDQAANMGFVNQQMKKAAPRNLLGNSYFRNPVNQREQTSFTTRGYTIDRWFLDYVGDSGISLSDNGLTFGTTNNLIVYLQKIGKEVRKKLIGKTVTVVATDSNGNVGISTGIIPDFGGNLDSPQVCIGETKLRCNIFCYEAEDAIQIRLLTDNLSSPVTVANIALYEGEYTAETLPEYQQKEYGAELYECRRYYREDEIVEINHGGLSGTIMLNTPFYEPPMRVTPTYTIKNFAAGMGDLSESSAIANTWGGDNRRIKLNYNSTGAASQCVFTLVSNAEM